MIDGVAGISSKVSASLCSEKMSGGTVVAISCPALIILPIVGFVLAG